MCATDKGSFFSARLWSHVCLSRRIYAGQPHSYRRQNNWELTWECNFQPTIIWGSIAQYQCLRTLQAMMTREETKWETLEGSLRNWQSYKVRKARLTGRISTAEKILRGIRVASFWFRRTSHCQEKRIPSMICSSIDHPWWQWPCSKAPLGQVPTLPAVRGAS